MGESALLFGRGLLRHFLYWVPGVFLGVLELVQRETGKSIAVPAWVFWSVFGAGVLLAAFLAFHELRVEKDSARDAGPDSRYDPLNDLLGRSLSVGVGLSEGRELPLLNAWRTHTERLIASAYGAGEAAHIFTPELKGSKVHYGRSISLALMESPPPLAEAINNVKALLGRMNLMIIRPDFDPAEWSVFNPDAFKEENGRPAGKGQTDAAWVCPWCSEEHDEWMRHCRGCEAENDEGMVYRPTGDP